MSLYSDPESDLFPNTEKYKYLMIFNFLEAQPISRFFYPSTATNLIPYFKKWNFINSFFHFWISRFSSSRLPT